MKSFQEFLEEGRKKQIKNLAKKIKKRVKKDIKGQLKSNPGKPVVADYGNAPVGSKESEAAIMAMMQRDAEWRKRMRDNPSSSDTGA